MIRGVVWKLGLPLVVAAAVIGALLPASARAQEPGAQAVSVCPAFEAPNGVAVCVDRGAGATYVEGDPIRICVTVNIPQIAIFPPPPPPLVRVTDHVDGHPPRVIFEEYFAGGQRCIDGTITAPFGRETIRAEVIDRQGRVFASDSTVFFSQPRQQPPQAASIAIDRGPGSTYRVNDWIRICYRVPGPGYVTIIDTLADGRSHVLLAGYDDGAGDCFYGIVTPPPGRECLRLEYNTSAGSGTRRVCFRVIH
jgi:hypothetical protein